MTREIETWLSDSRADAAEHRPDFLTDERVASAANVAKTVGTDRQTPERRYTVSAMGAAGA